ncbi:MAG: TIGR01777 family oxidoreductase [Deltaproteobacteria bacterium]
MKNILITGGTGLVGKEIKKLLDSRGYKTGILTGRKVIQEENSFYWDYEKGIIDDNAIEFADVIIHLAGENISAKRWDKRQKEKILNSRVGTTKLLYDAINRNEKKPQKIISASAVGYYGAVTTDRIFDETDPPGTDFLSDVVIKWEDSVKKFKDLNVDYNLLRLGVVISPQGGALEKMITPVKYFVGSPTGTGKQYMPWIEISDLACIFLFLVENKRENEIYNAVAPEHIDNRQFTRSLAKAIKRPMIFPPVPEWLLRLIFGEMAVIITEGSRVSSHKLLKEGFSFRYNKIDEVFKDYFGKQDNLYKQ